MGVVIKQSFWGTFITYLGVIIGYVSTLYLRPEFFSLDQIGLFTLVTANAMMVSPLCSVGMSGSYVKYFPLFKDSVKLKSQIFSFQFAVIIVSNILIISIALLNRDWIISKFSEDSSDYVNYLYITAIVVVVNSLFEHLFAYSATMLKVVFPSFLREIQLRLGAVVLILGFAGGYYDFDWAVQGLAINYSLALFLLFGNLILVRKLRFDLSFFKISREWKIKILRFSLYSMLVALSFSVLNNVSYSQVSTMMGDDFNGILVTCFFIGVIVEMPRRNMARVIGPLLSNAMAHKEYDEVEKIYKRGSITMTVIGALLFIGIVTNLNDLFSFIPKGDEFSLGFWIVIAVCGAKLVLMVSSFSGEILNYSDHYKYNLFFQVIAAVVLIVLNYLLIPIYGLNGVAISYFSTITLHVIAKFFMVRRILGINPFIKSHVQLGIISVLVWVAFYFFKPDFSPFLSIAFRSVLTTVFFTFLVYRFKVSEDINKLIDLIILQIKTKIGI